MLFPSITRRASALAVLGLLPALFAAGETTRQFETKKEGTRLIGKVEEVARDIHRNADRLNSLNRNIHVSAGTHYDHLVQIKLLVNDGLRPALTRLSEIRSELPDWQQHSIDLMLDSAKTLAADTNSAILSRNDAGMRPVVLTPEYGELVARLEKGADVLVRTSDAASSYSGAHQKAVEAGINVPGQ